MTYFYLMFISGHSHYLRLKVLRRYLPYISCGQPVCHALIEDGGKNIKVLTGKIKDKNNNDLEDPTED